MGNRLRVAGGWNLIRVRVIVRASLAAAAIQAIQVSGKATLVKLSLIKRLKGVWPKLSERGKEWVNESGIYADTKYSVRTQESAHKLREVQAVTTSIKEKRQVHRRRGLNGSKNRVHAKVVRSSCLRLVLMPYCMSGMSMW